VRYPAANRDAPRGVGVGTSALRRTMKEIKRSRHEEDRFLSFSERHLVRQQRLARLRAASQDSEESVRRSKPLVREGLSIRAF